jgi:tRNA-specific 2-thiouridylase
MLTQAELCRLRLPIGEMTKAEVRSEAAALGLRTAAKPDSQDVCFISRIGGREAFLGERIPLRPGRVVDRSGAEVGRVPAVELVTLGQRRGLGTVGTGPAMGDRRYAVAVDVESGTVTVGGLEELLVEKLAVDGVTWTSSAVAAGAAVEVQMSAHGRPVGGWWDGDGRVRLAERVRCVAPGQSVVLYQGDQVLGGGISRETVTASR